MTPPTPLNRLNLSMLGLLAAGTVAGFLVVPLGAELPIHWDLAGEADAFAPAPMALLLPVVMGLVVVGLLAFRLRSASRDFVAGRHAIEAATALVLGLALLLLATTIAIGLGQSVDVPRLIGGALGIVWLVLGNFLPKTQPNAVAGIRLPWTLRDSRNWHVTHRWTGMLMMLGGAVTLLVALLNPAPAVILPVALAAALVPLLIGTVISYRLSRQQAPQA